MAKGRFICVLKKQLQDPRFSVLIDKPHHLTIQQAKLFFRVVFIVKAKESSSQASDVH